MSLLNNTKTYLFSNIVNAAIPFILLPILTKVLTPSEYGQVAMFQTLIVGLSAFVGVNTVDAAKRRYYDDVGHNELLEYNGACFHILVLSSILVLFTLYLFLDESSAFLSIPESWVFYSILYSFCSYIIIFRLAQWQIRGESTFYAKLSILNSLFNLAASLILVVGLQYGASGRVEAQLLAISGAAVLALFHLLKDKLLIIDKFRYSNLKQALQFGIPLIPHVFGYFLLTSIDRFVINKELGLSQAGIYMVAIQLSMILNIVFDALNKAYLPWLFDVLKRNITEEKCQVVKYTYIYFLFLLFISIIPFIFGSWGVEIVAGKEYYVSNVVVGLVCLGQIFGGMYRMVTNYIFYSKKTGSLAMVTIISGSINVILLLLLVPDYGFLGAGFAFSLSKLIQFLFTWWMAFRVIDMPWFNFYRNGPNFKD